MVEYAYLRRDQMKCLHCSVVQAHLLSRLFQAQALRVVPRQPSSSQALRLSPPQLPLGVLAERSRHHEHHQPQPLASMEGTLREPSLATPLQDPPGALSELLRFLLIFVPAALVSTSQLQPAVQALATPPCAPARRFHVLALMQHLFPAGPPPKVSSCLDLAALLLAAHRLDESTHLGGFQRTPERVPVGRRLLGCPVPMPLSGCTPC
mmetsp:Transcript_8296/g.19521  ORF Transcript_8296/g.19521 Transcript_8296/m.19521 type:complete len:208 (+) Transcript_8296:1165-1788(+)